MTMLGLKLGGWFGKDDRRKLDLEPGAVFRKVRPDNLVEKATVLSITKDTYGIPHVRFDVALESPSHLRLTDGGVVGYGDERVAHRALASASVKLLELACRGASRRAHE